MNEQMHLLMIKNSIIDYLTEQLEINSNSLKQYEVDRLLPDNTPDEIVRMREIEAIKLRDRIHELTSHIAAIKRIIPVTDEPTTAKTPTDKVNKKATKR